MIENGVIRLVWVFSTKQSNVDGFDTFDDVVNFRNLLEKNNVGDNWHDATTIGENVIG